jgi:glycosyltransferase involved in cell wall biosynthesis
MKVGIVVPHIFMQHDILPSVIFSPGALAISLGYGLKDKGIDVTLFTPGAIPGLTHENVTADLSYFEAELAGRGYGYIELLKKHPLTFISLARSVQSELVAKAFAMANAGELDVVHIYTNEEDIALPFAQFCTKPVVFTHHDPFNFSVKYKNIFPKYKDLNWLSISLAQRKGMPDDTNWLANTYHGLDERELQYQEAAAEDQYIAYLGRIIQPKGVHLAIAAIKAHNAQSERKYKLRIAGKHYADASKDSYWQEHIEPLIDGDEIQYIGFIKTPAEKQAFLGNATALIIPSLFEEPFGMVMIEALACGTPLIGLDSGAIPEVITPQTGILAPKITRPGLAKQGLALKQEIDEAATVEGLAQAIIDVHELDRLACRTDFEARFTVERMAEAHIAAYKRLI